MFTSCTKLQLDDKAFQPHSSGQNEGQTITGYPLSHILPGSYRPGHSCTALLVSRGLCCGNGWAISAECWRAVGAKIRGVPSGKEHTLLPGHCCLQAVCVPGNWALPGAATSQHWDGDAQGAWCKREGPWVVRWDSHPWAPDSSNPCLNLGRERQAMPELSLSFLLWLLNCSALLGRKQDPGSLIPTP